jgi:hypothetical protein
MRSPLFKRVVLAALVVAVVVTAAVAFGGRQETQAAAAAKATIFTGRVNFPATADKTVLYRIPNMGYITYWTSTKTVYWVNDTGGNVTVDTSKGYYGGRSTEWGLAEFPEPVVHDVSWVIISDDVAPTHVTSFTCAVEATTTINKATR